MAYTKPQQRKKEENERLRGEGDQIKFTDLRFERWQVAGFRKARGRQDQCVTFRIKLCFWHPNELHFHGFDWHGCIEVVDLIVKLIMLPSFSAICKFCTSILISLQKTNGKCSPCTLRHIQSGNLSPFHRVVDHRPWRGKQTISSSTC